MVKDSSTTSIQKPMNNICNIYKYNKLNIIIQLFYEVDQNENG